MPHRAEHLLAQAWRRSTKELREPEGFLEDALAAALEHPEVWARLVTHLGWTARFPTSPPQIITQQVETTGRTDIRLTWLDGPTLILELKVHDPPGATQIQTYLDLPGAPLVAGVAGRGASLHISPAAATRYLGIVTWSRIRALVWSEAPLVLRQLHQLLDAMGVVMPQISLTGLIGVVASWDTWIAIDAWANRGARAARDVLSAAGLPCQFSDGGRDKSDADQSAQRYAYWFWPAPWRADRLSFFAGIFIGRPGDPTCVEGAPDLILGLSSKPGTPLMQMLLTDEQLLATVERWQLHESPLERREFTTPSSTWEIIRVRGSMVDVLRAPDQAQAWSDWMAQAARELTQHGVIARLAAIERATRPNAGSEPSDEGAHQADS